MSKKENKFKFKNNNFDSTIPITPEHKRQLEENISQNNRLLEQRNAAKLELINKYGMSENEAEMTLQNIEKEVMQTKSKEKTVKKTNNEIEDIFDKNVSKENEMNEIEDSQNKEDITNDKIGNAEMDYKNYEKPEENKNSSQKVDDILSNIVPNYQKELSIELTNVSLSFEISAEKIDNLKELFIRTLKRNKKPITHFQALKDINLKIYKGEKIGIIGYNGAGKSTLLNVITGIYPPETGEVKTYGKISPLLALGAGFDHNYSGRENIFLNGAIMGYSKKFLESKYDEIVEFSELEEFIDFPVKNYSSGMLAKLGFSIATIVEPDILIIDEVLGVGDVNFSKKSSDKIKSLMDTGTTVLLVSHSIPQIRHLCDKAIWIDKGEVREIGEVNTVCNHYLKDAEKATKEQLKDIRFR